MPAWSISSSARSPWRGASVRANSGPSGPATSSTGSRPASRFSPPEHPRRGLRRDAVQTANSGHPGTAMALAPLAHVRLARVMRYDATEPDWPDRDRFILSAGHASMLLYSMLYLAGYGLTLDHIKQFRQWG